MHKRPYHFLNNLVKFSTYMYAHAYMFQISTKIGQNDSTCFSFATAALTVEILT